MSTDAIISAISTLKEKYNQVANQELPDWVNIHDLKSGVALKERADAIQFEKELQSLIDFVRQVSSTDSPTSY